MSSGRQDEGEASRRREVVVPRAEERVVAGRRVRTTATVRVEKKVREREELVDEPVRIEEVCVERVPIGRYVESAAPTREEGGTLIIPVHEEVLVVERRLLLKEEIHVTKTTREERHREVVVLRSEEVEITRHPAPDAESESDAGQGATT